MGESQKTGNKSFFLSFTGIIQKFCQKIENIPGKVPEFVASMFYAVMHIFISIFHEPWYDEAVAWQIARCVSIKDILFEIPHYEGHPPLWHLILAPFAKLGAPYELSLCIVSLIFAGAACCLIIWKSPFPRIIRLLLPFTYFFFYQYSVISRPYCVMMLVFVLLAMTHHKRNENPRIYVGLLMLLCLTSAYGLLIAGGITIAWILEMWSGQNINSFIKKMLRDKRTLWLFVLLIFAILLVLVIMPREATAATSNMGEQYKYNIEGIIRCILYMFFALPAEVTMTTVYADYHFLNTIDIPWISIIITCLLGILIWFFIIRFGRRKKTTLTLIIPYTLYAMFAAFVYVCNHHIGIGLLIFVFWFWISLKEDNEKEIKEKKSEQKRELISSILLLFGSLAMIISLWWNVTSCIQEVLYSYSIGKNEAKFIKENGLDNYRIMAGWGVSYDEDGDVKEMDVTQFQFADNIAPYFDKNIFFNFNGGEDTLNYSTHKKVSQEEVEATIAYWQEQPPEVLYMYPSIELIYEGIDLHAYKVVYHQKSYRMWKGFLGYEASKIYVHEDLIEELNLDVCGAETYARMLLYSDQQ